MSKSLIRNTLPRCLSMFALFAMSAMVVSPTAAATQEITVSAAISLTDAFKDLARLYEERYPGSKVHLNFGASETLLQQIANGAPVDVFASADEETMRRAQTMALVEPESPVLFATNQLVLVQPKAAENRLSSLDDLTAAAVRLITIGRPGSVPAGRYARHALEVAGVWRQLKGKLVYAQNVRQALNYVARGEVAAGFVYLTDAQSVGDQVQIALNTDITVAYPIAMIRASHSQPDARQFIDLVMSDEGQATLTRYGFGRAARD